MIYAPPLSRIKERVAAEFGVAAIDLESDRRAKKYVVARHVAMHLAYRLTQWSSAHVGREFGGRDHATVLHAARRTALRMRADRAFSERVRRLERELGDPAQSAACAAVDEAVDRVLDGALTEVRGLAVRAVDRDPRAALLAVRAALRAVAAPETRKEEE